MFRLLLSHLPGELNLIKLLKIFFDFLYVGSWSMSNVVMFLCCGCVVLLARVQLESEQEAQRNHSTGT